MDRIGEFIAVVVITIIVLAINYISYKTKKEKNKKQEAQIYNDIDYKDVVNEISEVFKGSPKKSEKLVRPERVYVKSKNEDSLLAKNQQMLQKANIIKSRIQKTETKNINEKKMLITDKKINKKPKPEHIGMGKEDMKKYFLFHEVIDRKYDDQQRMF